MDRRADVVGVAGEGERLGTHAATNLPLRFQDEHGAAGTRQDDGGGQAIRARADHNRVVIATLLQDAAIL